MTQSVAIRLGVEGGAEVKREFGDVGAAGKQAFDGVVVSMDRAGTASDRQVQRFQRLAQAAKEAEAAGRAQSSINSLLGVEAGPSTSARSSAGVFEQQLRAAEEAERRNAAIAEARAAQFATTTQANLSSIYGIGATPSKSARASADVFEEAARAADEEERRAAVLRDARAAQMAATNQANVSAAYGVNAAPVKSARASAEVFEEAARAQEDLEKRASALREVIDPLGAAQLRMNAAVANADELLAKGSIRVNEHTAAVAKARTTYDELAKSADRQRAGGLRADQLQNVTYQVSDVVASAASGASPLTILMQQGPQLAQILGPGQGVGGMISGIGEAIGKLVTPLTATAGVIATIGGTLAYAYSTYSAGQREAQMSLNGIGRLSGATVAQMNATAEASARQGEVSVASAREMAGVYASTGRIAPQFFGDLIKIQRDYAATTKQEIPEATRDLAGALANVATGVDALEGKLGPLGGGAGDMAKKLAAAGDQTGAVKVILDALPATLNKASTQMGGLSREWERTKQGFSDNINFIGKALFGEGTDTFEKRIADAQARLNELEASRSKYGNRSNSYLYEAEATRQRKVVSDLQAQADTARNAPARAQADDIANQTSRATKLVNPELASIEALEAVRDRIGKGLSTVLLSPDPKVNVGAQEALESYKALDAQVIELRANLAKGGDAAAAALKQADFAKSTADLQGYSLAVAQVNHQYDQLVDQARKAGDAGRRTVSIETLNEARTSALAALAAQNRQAVLRSTAIPNDAVATTIMAESRGNNNAKNPDSSALGAGQFIKSTFVNLYRQYDSEAAAEIDASSANRKEADERIARLRTDKAINEKYVAIYIQEITNSLMKSGLDASPRNIQLGYFLGPEGAKRMLRADPSANAASIDPAAAASNQRVFKNGNATVQDILNYGQSRVTGNGAPARASNERVIALRAEAAAYDQSASRQEYLRTVQEQLNAARENGEEIGIRFKTAEELLKTPVSDLTAELQAQRSAYQAIAEARQTAASTALSSRFERDTANAYSALGRTPEEQSAYMGARSYAEEGTKEFETYRDRLRDLQRLSETKSATGGFLKDLKNDLSQGASLTTAMSNALGRLASRLSDKVLDSAVSMMFAGSSKDGGSIGTFLSSILPKYATGMTPAGVVYGPGTGTSDSILAMISNGESIVNADATRRFGPVIKAMNENRLPRFAGGYVPKFDSPANSNASANVTLNVINQSSNARVETREVPDGRGGRKQEALIVDAFVQGASSRQGQRAMSRPQIGST